MTVYTESRIIFAPADLLFRLVADVERYPEFLPMWKWACIRRWDGPSTYYTAQDVGFGPIRERFDTKTTLAPPESIIVTSSDRLFREFYIRWTFAEAPKGCRTSIELKWQARSFLLQKGIEVVLPKTAEMMVDAFEKRAHDVMRKADQRSQPPRS
jgi:coenzyme Q-binding protein COQ10